MLAKFTQILPIVATPVVLLLSSFAISYAGAGAPPSAGVRELLENNFTLDYGATLPGDLIEPGTQQYLYDSGSNNLTSISSGEIIMGGSVIKTSLLTDEEEKKLIDILARGDLVNVSFNSDSCHRACQPAHLTINVPALNKTNTFSWTVESSETLDSLSSLQGELDSLGGTPDTVIQ